MKAVDKNSEAVKFVNKFGWGEAKRILNDARGCVSVRLYDKYEFMTDDLKTLVEAKELVDLYGGLSEAKLKSEIPMCFGDNDFFQEVTLKKAIKLVESVENDQTRD